VVAELEEYEALVHCEGDTDGLIEASSAIKTREIDPTCDESADK
jgi:hypothetical protein